MLDHLNLHQQYCQWKSTWTGEDGLDPERGLGFGRCSCHRTCPIPGHISPSALPPFPPCSALLWPVPPSFCLRSLRQLVHCLVLGHYHWVHCHTDLATHYLRQWPGVALRRGCICTRMYFWWVKIGLKASLKAFGCDANQTGTPVPWMYIALQSNGPNLWGALIGKASLI